MLLHKACSILDPFCAAARGAKVNDGSSINSLSVQCRGFVRLLTNANGFAAAAFSSDPTIGYRTADTTTGDVVNTWNADNDYSGFTGIPASAQWRQVTGGVHVYSTASMMNNQGMLGICVLPSSSLPP